MLALYLDSGFLPFQSTSLANGCGPAKSKAAVFPFIRKHYERKKTNKICGVGKHRSWRVLQNSQQRMGVIILPFAKDQKNQEFGDNILNLA